jgi:hypothetical protein
MLNGVRVSHHIYFAPLSSLLQCRRRRGSGAKVPDFCVSEEGIA